MTIQTLKLKKVRCLTIHIANFVFTCQIYNLSTEYYELIPLPPYYLTVVITNYTMRKSTYELDTLCLS